jgi:hypothetical protein
VGLTGFCERLAGSSRAHSPYHNDRRYFADEMQIHAKTNQPCHAEHDHPRLQQPSNALAGVPSGRYLHESRFAFEGLRNVGIDLRPEALRVSALCGIWANSKFFLLARSRRADRVGQQATQRTASTGVSGRIPISSEELL